MLKNISNWLYKVTKGWVALAGAVIFLLFGALVLPTQASSSESNMQTPDLSLYYTPNDLYHMAESYGEDGRQDYIRARFTFDLVWPIVYGLFLVTSLTWLYSRVFPPASAWRFANLAPLLGMLFDYLENVSTSLVMLRYPQTTPVVATLAPLFTLVKWVFVGGSFILLLVASGILVYHRVRN